MRLSLQDKKAVAAGILAACSSTLQAVADNAFSVIDVTLIIVSGLTAWAVTWSVGNPKNESDTSDQEVEDDTPARHVEN